MSPSDVIMHPKWDSTTHRYDFDIAVILFDYEVPYNQVIRPICISSNNLTALEGTGQGEESHDKTKPRSNTPKQITVPIVSNEQCFLESDFNKIASSRTLCAGTRNGSGICHGDSGAGLFSRVGDAFYLKGLVSASLRSTTLSCDVNDFALYTNIDAYKAWIENPTDDSNEEPAEVESGSRISVTTATKQSATCGAINRSRSLVHSGSSATREEFPWTVAIFYKEDHVYVYVATGSLVSSRHVVAPGQSVLIKNTILNNPHYVQLYFGVIDFDETLPETARYVDGVQSIMHHPENSQKLPKTANLAIFVMRKAVKFSKYISPVCIPQGPINIVEITGKTAFAIGWGIDDSGFRSRMRNFSPVKIKSKQICERHHENENLGSGLKIPSTYFCAGSDGFKSAGTGDDHLYFRKNGKWDLIGMLVYGIIERGELKYNLPIL